MYGRMYTTYGYQGGHIYRDIPTTHHTREVYMRLRIPSPWENSLYMRLRIPLT